MNVSTYAGKLAEPSMLVNVPGLITAYYTDVPDPSEPEQRISSGSSGHRGSPFRRGINERYILAISQAICLYREQKKIDGPRFSIWTRMRFPCRLLPVPLRYMTTRTPTPDPLHSKKACLPTAHQKQFVCYRQRDHNAYVHNHFEDLPEIENWKWRG
jgi:hypothetical protein